MNRWNVVQRQFFSEDAKGEGKKGCRRGGGCVCANMEEGEEMGDGGGGRRGRDPHTGEERQQWQSRQRGIYNLVARYPSSPSLKYLSLSARTFVHRWAEILSDPPPSSFSPRKANLPRNRGSLLTVETACFSPNENELVRETLFGLR